MGDAIDFRVLELLCGRLCHELISPVGAINNGVELLGEDDPEFVKEAMTLIGQSARKAGQRLQFYRFAYGTAGAGAAAAGSAPNCRELALGLIEGGKVRCEWSPELGGASVAQQRLACNMFVLGVDMLPRGGTVVASRAGDGVEIAAQGDTVTINAEAKEALAHGATADILTARNVHAFYTMLLARHLGARLVLEQPEPGRAMLTAAPL